MNDPDVDLLQLDRGLQQLQIENETGNEYYSLFKYARENDVKRIHQLLITYPTLDINRKDRDGDTVVHMTARGACRDVLHWLAVHCDTLDLNLTNQHGYTPLLIATSQCLNHTQNSSHLAFIQLLLHLGADLYYRSPRGDTVMDMLHTCRTLPITQIQHIIEIVQDAVQHPGRDVLAAKNRTIASLHQQLKQQQQSAKDSLSSSTTQFEYLSHQHQHQSDHLTSILTRIQQQLHDMETQLRALHTQQQYVLVAEVHHAVTVIQSTLHQTIPPTQPTLAITSPQTSVTSTSTLTRTPAHLPAPTIPYALAQAHDQSSTPQARDSTIHATAPAPSPAQSPSPSSSPSPSPSPPLSVSTSSHQVLSPPPPSLLPIVHVRPNVPVETAPRPPFLSPTHTSTSVSRTVQLLL